MQSEIVLHVRPCAERSNIARLHSSTCPVASPAVFRIEGAGVEKTIAKLRVMGVPVSKCSCVTHTSQLTFF
jgi:hypothetical protein